jgi:hypothetical protein
MTPLMAQAAGVFGGQVEVPAESLRGSCWLARAALEDAVRAALDSRGHDLGGSTNMTSTLGCLESALAGTVPGLATEARLTWHGLSASCHHHSYELAPTVGEVQHLLQRAVAVCADLSAYVSAHSR